MYYEVIETLNLALFPESITAGFCCCCCCKTATEQKPGEWGKKRLVDQWQQLNDLGQGFLCMSGRFEIRFWRLAWCPVNSLQPQQLCRSSADTGGGGGAAASNWKKHRKASAQPLPQIAPLADHLIQGQSYSSPEIIVAPPCCLRRQQYLQASSTPRIMGNGPKKKHHKSRSEHFPCAASYVTQWTSLYKKSELCYSSSMDSSLALDDWIPAYTSSSSPHKPPIIDLHTHSTCSDGMLSPVQLVEKAISSGVQVLALTDHDTMAGVPAALEAAHGLRIRLIPGVEISAKVETRLKSGFEEPVHILGYYSCCGPARWQELEKVLSRIREGRHHRAEAILSKLKSLKKPVTWERVVAMAGAGVAPGRVHIARALVEAGHVDSLREAFNKYLYDGGPAYAPGFGLAAEDAVRLVCDTGGVAALAHPWSLKDPLSVVKKLKGAGLHAMEVYRGDGKANGFAAMAETYELLKLGGSDFHGRGDPDETKLGKVSLPLLTIHEFLRVAQPIWINAIKDLLQSFAEETFEINLEKVAGLKYFTGHDSLKGDISLGYLIKEGRHNAFLRLSPWLTEEERQTVREEVTQLELKCEMVAEDGKVTCIVSQLG